MHADHHTDNKYSTNLRAVLIYVFILFLVSCSNKDVRVEYYSNGQIHLKCEISANGVRDGAYISYYQNGQKRSEGNYKNDKQTGFWITWHENGNKSSEGSYKNGLQTNEWRFYYKNGKLQQINHFLNDKEEGEFIDYDTNGIRTRKGLCTNGLMKGKEIKFYPNGKVLAEVTWKNHKTDGPFTEYYPDGKLMSKGVWKDTVLVGEYFQFDSLNNSNYEKFIFYLKDKVMLSDTSWIFTNGKLTQVKIIHKNGVEEHIKVNY